MHTLQQLRSGELTGATRLDLSCGLREFPGKSSNWPTPGGAQPQRQRPGQPAGRPRPAASSQGAVLFRQRLRRIAGGGGRLSGAEHGRLQVQPHRAGAGRGPAAGVALADPHRQPDCHAARGTGPPAVAEADVGRQPPGGLAREHGRLRRPGTAADRRQPFPAPAGLAGDAAAPGLAGLRRQPVVPPAGAGRQRHRRAGLERAEPGRADRRRSLRGHPSRRLAPAGRLDAHGGAEAVQGRSDQRWHPASEMAACLAAGAMRN